MSKNWWSIFLIMGKVFWIIVKSFNLPHKFNDLYRMNIYSLSCKTFQIACEIGFINTCTQKKKFARLFRIKILFCFAPIWFLSVIFTWKGSRKMSMNIFEWASLSWMNWDYLNIYLNFFYIQNGFNINIIHINRSLKQRSMLNDRMHTKYRTLNKSILKSSH